MDRIDKDRDESEPLVTSVLSLQRARNGRISSPSPISRHFSHPFIYLLLSTRAIVSNYSIKLPLKLLFSPKNILIDNFGSLETWSLRNLTLNAKFEGGGRKCGEQGSLGLGWHRCSTGRSHVEAHGASRWQSPSSHHPLPKKNTRGGGPSIVAEGVINEKGISRQPPRVGIAQAAQACTPRTCSFPPKIFTFLPSLHLKASPSPRVSTYSSFFLYDHFIVLSFS